MTIRLPPTPEISAKASLMRRWWRSKAAQRWRLRILVWALPGACSSGQVGLRNSLMKYSRPSLAAKVHLLRPAPTTRKSSRIL